MLNGDLTIRVDDGHTDRHVTRYASGLTFTKTAPGGHQACSFTLDMPYRTFTDLGPADRCWIYDKRTGRTVFGAAYLENPTPVDGPDGQTWDISALGGMVRANDENRALVYIDQALDGWAKASDSTKSTNVDTGDLQDAAGAGLGSGLLDQFPSGEVVATGDQASAGYYTIQRAGMLLGGLTASIVGGKTDVGYQVQVVTDSGTTITGAMGTVPGTVNLFVVSDFAAGAAVCGIRLKRLGAATNVVDDLTWIAATAVSAIGQRMDRHGTLLTGAGGLVSNSSVLASQIVEDLLGRLLTFCDPGTAQVDTTAFAISQLAYPDGTKAAAVLNDLTLYEPDFLWEIGETLDSGLHRFAYRAWPTTTPRYVFSTKDGWRQDGGDVDLCNRILITWTDLLGNTRTTKVTAASLGLVGLGYPVDQLEAEGRTKDADPIDLPGRANSLLGTDPDVARIAAGILRDKINPPLAGTLTVRRKVLDLLTGNMVQPWELEPGYLGRVRELGQDLRITQVDYGDDPEPAAVLTLGRPVLKPEQRIALLIRGR